MSEKIYLDTATKIGDLLCELAISDGRHVYWKVFDRIQKKTFDSPSNLYLGNSGIGLFFLELYKHTHRQKYLHIARKAILTAAASERAKKQPTSSFLSGSLGVVYALARLYEITGVAMHRDRALALLQKCRGIYNERQEYLSGNAGSLLAILHIHTIFKEQWLLDMANEYASHILRGMRHDVTGIYWDRSPLHIRPLCGFSHGVAGIGFVFLELGRYVKNPAFYTIADQAFAYENAHFDQASNNWLDFRVDMWDLQKIAKLEAAYSKGDTAALTEPRTMVAWCHGAPGIGLSRIAAFQLTGNQAYKRDMNRAIVTTKNVVPHDISLCHGLAGNADTFIESYLAFGKAQDWEDAQAFGGQLLRQWERHKATRSDKTFQDQFDPALFTGAAGAGYELLRLSNPTLTPSILAPRLVKTLGKRPGKKLSALSITEAEVQAIVLHDDATESLAIKQLKRQMLTDQPSDALLFIKQRVGQKAAQRLLQLSDNHLQEQILQLDPHCHLYSDDKVTHFLRHTPEGIEQKDISQFCYIVLAVFEQPQKVDDVISMISKRYNIPQQEYEALQTKVLEQVRHALSVQLLTSKDA